MSTKTTTYCGSIYRASSGGIQGCFGNYDISVYIVDSGAYAGNTHVNGTLTFGMGGASNVENTYSISCSIDVASGGETYWNIEKLVTEEYGNKNFIRYGFYQAPDGDSYKRLMIHNSSYLNGKFCCVDRSGNEYVITIKSGTPTSFCKVNDVNSSTERIVDIRFYTEDVTKIHLYIHSVSWNSLNYYFLSDSESKIDEFDSNPTEYNDASPITWQKLAPANGTLNPISSLSDANSATAGSSIKYAVSSNTTSNLPTDISVLYGLLEISQNSVGNALVQTLTAIYYGTNNEALIASYHRSAYFNGNNWMWSAWERFAVKSDLPTSGVGTGINKQDIVSGDANTAINIPAYHFCSGFMYLAISGIGTALLSYDIDFDRNLTLKVIAGTGISLTGLTLYKGQTPLGAFSANGDYIVFSAQYYTIIRTNYASL
jgi:hypothetical protein